MLCSSGFELYSRWVPLITQDKLCWGNGKFTGHNLAIYRKKITYILAGSHEKTERERLGFFSRARDLTLRYGQNRF